MFFLSAKMMMMTKVTLNKSEDIIVARKAAIFDTIFYKYFLCTSYPA